MQCTLRCLHSDGLASLRTTLVPQLCLNTVCTFLCFVYLPGKRLKQFIVYLGVLRSTSFSQRTTNIKEEREAETRSGRHKERVGSIQYRGGGESPRRDEIHYVFLHLTSAPSISMHLLFWLGNLGHHFSKIQFLICEMG